MEKDYIKRLNGVYRAVVVNNKDPNNLRRIKVQAQPTGLQVSDWVWPILSTKRPPAIGTGCWIMYVGGDPEYPVWIGEFAENLQGLFCYGSWSSSVDQIATIDTAKAVDFNTTSYESGVTLKDSSKFTIEQSGTYNVQFSCQLHNTGGGGSGNLAYIWFRKNGVDIPNSATSIVVASGNYEVITVNVFEKMETNDYLQIYWAQNNTSIRLEHLPATSVHPAIPSIIATVNQIA